MSNRRSRLESFLMRTWSARGPFAWLLLPVSLVMRALVALRRRAYAAGWLASTRLPVPVIVVGNIYVGGTGKTPFSIWLVQALQQAGFRPGVISRGYGAQNDTPREVFDTSAAADVGDEPLLIAQHTGVPVVVGRRRVAAAQALLAANPGIDVIISDDGLQHYALQRDIEIVLFDQRGVGNGWLLPAGPLREPASRRRDFTVVNGMTNPPRVGRDPVQMRLAPAQVEQLRDPQRTMPLAALTAAGKRRPARIAAAAGIGNPQRFFAMLQQAGIAFSAMPLPDHYDFSGDPFKDVAADLILLTEKDAVKCRQIDILKRDPRLWVVPVSAEIDDALAANIVEKLRGHPTA